MTETKKLLAALGLGLGLTLIAALSLSSQPTVYAIQPEGKLASEDTLLTRRPSGPSGAPVSTNYHSATLPVMEAGLHTAVQVTRTITLNPSTPGKIYIGTDLGVFASDDHGYSWSTAHSYPDNEGPANVEVADLFWSNEYLIAATHGRGMYRTKPLSFIYVDRLAPSGGDGSYDHPFRTVTEALNAAGHGIR